MSIRQGYEMAGGGGLRASDADRERAVEVLKTGYAEGRMPKDEYDARVGQAYTVPTRADLELVTAQLPGGGSVLYAPEGRRARHPVGCRLAAVRSGPAVHRRALYHPGDRARPPRPPPDPPDRRGRR